MSTNIDSVWLVVRNAGAEPIYERASVAEVAKWIGWVKATPELYEELIDIQGVIFIFRAKNSSLPWNQLYYWDPDHEVST